MKSILIALVILIVINLLAIGVGIGWLAATDRLSSERMRDMIEMFRVTITEEEAATAEAQAEAEKAAEAQIEAIRLAEVADGPKTLEERLVDSRKVDEITAQRIERLKREREDIFRQIDAAKAMIAKQRTEIEGREEAFEQKVAAFRAQQEDKDFRQAVQMVEQLKPKQAKQVFQDMLALGDEKTVVDYLAMMNQRKAGAVLREFKAADEIPQARSLIEALRRRGIAFS